MSVGASRTFEDERDFLLALYPMVYLDEVDVLHHMFFAAGNGRTWTGGGLTRPVDDSVDTIEEIWGARKNDMHRFLDEMAPMLRAHPDHAYAAGIKRKLDVIDDRAAFASVCHEIERERRDKSESTGGTWRRHAAGWSQNLQAQTGFAPIYGIPDDVTPSWLDAISRAFLAIDDGRLRVSRAADVRWIERARRGVNEIRELRTVRVEAGHAVSEPVDLDSIRDALTVLHYGSDHSATPLTINTSLADTQNKALTVIINATPALVREIERLRATIDAKPLHLVK